MQGFRSIFMTSAMLALAGWTTAQADLVSHYDAGTITGASDLAPVNLWKDLSGNGNDATSTGTPRYLVDGIGGRPSVLFNRGDQGFVSSLLLGSQFGIQGDASWSMVAVFRPTSFSTQYGVAAMGWLGTTFHGVGIEMDGANLDLALGHGDDLRLRPDGSFSPFLNQDVIVIFSHIGGTGGSVLSTTELMINGYRPGEGILSGIALQALRTAGSTPLNLANNPVVLGGALVAGNSSFDGLLSEFSLYNHALSTAEKYRVVSSLGEKYGISVVPEPAGIVHLATGVFLFAAVSGVQTLRRFGGKRAGARDVRELGSA
ncbi:MAG: hypothetical protein SFX72_14055 [Isosphaeraceae bacterium]|nr:hypothetical protein [Isosphaeraceae bacterium]